MGLELDTCLPPSLPQSFLPSLYPSGIVFSSFVRSDRLLPLIDSDGRLSLHSIMLLIFFPLETPLLLRLHPSLPLKMDRHSSSSSHRSFPPSPALLFCFLQLCQASTIQQGSISTRLDCSGESLGPSLAEINARTDGDDIYEAWTGAKCRRKGSPYWLMALDQMGSFADTLATSQRDLSSVRVRGKERDDACCHPD